MLILILAARLNGAIGWVPNRKPDALEAGLFHSAFESQFRCSQTPLSHGLTGLVAINSIAELPGRALWRDGGCQQAHLASHSGEWVLAMGWHNGRSGAACAGLACCFCAESDGLFCYCSNSGKARQIVR